MCILFFRLPPPSIGSSIKYIEMGRGIVKHACFSFFFSKIQILNYTFQKNIKIHFWGKSHCIISGYFFLPEQRWKNPRKNKQRKKPQTSTQRPLKRPPLLLPPQVTIPPPTRQCQPWCDLDGTSWVIHPDKNSHSGKLYKEVTSCTHIISQIIPSYGTDGNSDHQSLS